MNKLFCIAFILKGKRFMYRNFWNEAEALQYIDSIRMDGWDVSLAENNKAHKIWEAR